MKLKPVIDSQDFQNRPRSLRLEIVAWVMERAKLLGGILGGLLLVAVVLSVNAIYFKMEEDRAAAVYIKATGVEPLLQLLQQYPNSKVAPLATYSLAHAYEEKEDWGQAETYTRMFVQKYPNHFLNPQARFALAYLTERKGETEKALQLYRELSASPNADVLGPELLAAVERCSRRLGKAGSS